MENATKALIIAATILIAVLILSVGIYIFNNYSELAYKTEENQAKQAIVQYNNKFIKYMDKTLKMQDVITIVNLAKDYNERKSDMKISVIMGPDLTTKTYNDLVEHYLKPEEPEKTYKIVELTYYDSENRFIKQITIN